MPGIEDLSSERKAELKQQRQRGETSPPPGSARRKPSRRRGRLTDDPDFVPPEPPYDDLDVPEGLRQRPFDRLPPGIQRRVRRQMP